MSIFVLHYMVITWNCWKRGKIHLMEQIKALLLLIMIINHHAIVKGISHRRYLYHDTIVYQCSSSSLCFPEEGVSLSLVLLCLSCVCCCLSGGRRCAVRWTIFLQRWLRVKHTMRRWICGASESSAMSFWLAVHLLKPRATRRRTVRFQE